MARETTALGHKLPGRLPKAIAVLVLIAFGLALATAVVLWLHYGTMVFFQMLATGIAACF